MSSAVPVMSESTMCSLVALDRRLDPIGTAAGRFGRHLFVEVALPWSRNVVQSSGFPPPLIELEKRAQEQGRPVRLLAIAPDGAYSIEGHTRIIYLRRPAEPFAEFLCDEWVVPDERLPLFAEALARSPEELDHFRTYQRERQGVRDVLVCTQGSRDACCGKFGYELYETLRARAGKPGDDSVRVWRVSHVGGHRFAPTVIELPELRQWGHVTPELMSAILDRTGDFGAVKRHYRGWAGLLSPWEQVLEREVLELEGWPCCSYPKSGRIIEFSADEKTARVELSLIMPEGVCKRYEADVEIYDTVTGPESCRDEGNTEFPCYRVRHIDVEVQCESAI